jgi:hypothetical protein
MIISLQYFVPDYLNLCIIKILSSVSAKEMFEDMKRLIRSGKLKDRQCYGKMEKKTRRQTIVDKTLNRSLKIDQHQHC